jgi:thioredoxin 1
MIVEGNRKNFEEEVLKYNGPVLVDFWGPSCGPCLALMPVVEEFAEKYDGKLKIVKVNTTENRRLCINLKVISLPTFILFNDGEEVKRLGPTVTKEELEQNVAEFVSSLPSS